MRLPLLPDPEKLIDSAVTGWDLLARSRRGRPDAHAVVDHPRGAPVHGAPLPLAPPRRAPTARRCCWCRRSPRRPPASTCAAAAAWPSTSPRSATRPTSSTTAPISFSDRALGLEHWVEDVIPTAVRVASEDAGGAPVQPLGWCLGGILTLLSAAADPDQPIASIALVASPFDFAQVRMMAPIRRIAKLTGGALGTALYRALGGAPAPLVSRGFQLTSLDRYLTKPLFLARNLHDRETIAHAEAVDAYMANMFAYPGRTFGQLYHALLPSELARRRQGRAARRPRDRPRRRAPAGARRSRATRTCSRPRRPCTTSASCCRTPSRSGSRPRPAATSACSPAARRSAPPGCTSTTSSPDTTRSGKRTSVY